MTSTSPRGSTAVPADEGLDDANAQPVPELPLFLGDPSPSPALTYVTAPVPTPPNAQMYSPSVASPHASPITSPMYNRERVVPVDDDIYVNEFGHLQRGLTTREHAPIPETSHEPEMSLSSPPEQTFTPLFDFDITPQQENDRRPVADPQPAIQERWRSRYTTQ